RLVREDADPDLAAALDVPGHGAPGGLDLPVAHPAGLDGLEAVVAEGDRGATRGDARAPAAVHLAVLDSLRDQHQASAFLVVFLAGAFLAVGAFSALGTAAVFALAAGLGVAFAGAVAASAFGFTAATRVRLGVTAGAGVSTACASTGSATIASATGCGAMSIGASGWGAIASPMGAPSVMGSL